MRQFGDQPKNFLALGVDRIALRHQAGDVAVADVPDGGLVVLGGPDVQAVVRFAYRGVSHKSLSAQRA